MTGSVYQGKCRANTFESTKRDYSIRVRVTDSELVVTDRIEGELRWHLSKDVGDFIVRRKDGLFAYQLAVVVDDAFQGVTDIVRGNDLIDSTPRQVYLARCLGYQEPVWCHIPVVVDDKGNKLSKQNHAPPIETGDVLSLIGRALSALGQTPAPHARNIDDLLAHAVQHWDAARIPRVRQIEYSSL